ncbi:hypothetical protein GTZ99_07890 [Novosphingobium sp. FSY-8]|uniref:Uncharacterized protein n=1 Tax=Novosphingobium ovatum TaxID=1908523 RepID=A0ABW9XD81_9SPHN|nr:hypothetical protein [Novosphingobium ovatum]NBC36474.1 hypothetical protein [Novosphingobium ovatum]
MDNADPVLDAKAAEAERRRIIAGRNNVTALVLVGLVVLFFAITIVKRTGHSAAETRAALEGHPVATAHSGAQ